MQFSEVFFYLCGAALWDWRRGKIPNRYLVIWGVFFLAASIRQERLLWFIVGAGAALLLLFPLFFFHMMGAGDIKLMALLCGWLGLFPGLRLIFYGLFSAAIWSFFYMMRKRIFLTRIGYFLCYIKQLSWYSGKLLQGERPAPYFDAERDGREAAFCLAPFLLLGYLIWLLLKG